MWKIIKKSVEEIKVNKNKFLLWMKWEFTIEFASDRFGPYDYKFEREDCYFNDWLEDRWTKVFPLKNKSFDNTEIFLETDDIVIAIWYRASLLWWEKTFIDIINIKTEQKYRLFTEEVNLIYNSIDKIIINANDEWIFKTLVLDINTMKKISETNEVLQAFFKCIYNKTVNKWFLLDFNIYDDNETNEEKKYQKGSFSLKKISAIWKPMKFLREKFEVKSEKWIIDIWEEIKN